VPLLILLQLLIDEGRYVGRARRLDWLPQPMQIVQKLVHGCDAEGNAAGAISMLFEVLSELADQR
jgi:hypothetical protein